MTNKPRFLLLYGSQTGQAEAIAEEIRDNAGNHGLEADFHCMDKTEKKFNIDRTTCAVIVVSTTGEGDAPDNAQKLWRRLKKRTLPSDHLSKLNYALLGLGDSNYVSFCMCGKNFDRRLKELSAKQFYDCGWGDDAVGLEVAVEPWIQGLWPALRAFHGMGEQTSNTMSGDHMDSNGLEMSRPSLNGAGDGIEAERSNIGENPTQSKKEVIDMTNGDEGLKNGPLENVISTSTVNSDVAADNTVVEKGTKKDYENRDAVSKLQSTLDVRIASIPKNTITAKGPDTLPSCDASLPQLTMSVPPLSESALTLPPLASPYLQIDYSQDQPDTSNLPLQNGHKLPSAASEVALVLVTKVTRLTRDDAVKTALEYQVSLEGTSLTYQPGDSFSVVCPNTKEEVDMLITRLSLEDVCHQTYTLHILPDTRKKNASIPSHIHAMSSLRHTITTCCDIREPPKKAFLRMLVEYTSDPGEKRRLQELCSKQGASDYTRFIREPNIGILDLLLAFRSCQPPIERLLEHLTRLQPRPYSASCSPLSHPNQLRFVFNIIQIPSGDGRQYKRKGICTGWLRSVAGKSLDSPLEDGMEKMSIENNQINLKIPIFLRTNQRFHLPDDPTLPIIMIGPGTGVAPFVGFLQHRRQQAKEGNLTVGKMWLFYGCRHKERDYLYRKDLEHFEETGVLTKLSVCFSRDGSDDVKDSNEDTTPSCEGEIISICVTPRYVQDNIRLNAEEVLKWICDEDAVVYVCGDAKNMARGVNDTLVELLKKHRGMDDANGFLMKLRLKKRYHEDIWS